MNAMDALAGTEFAQRPSRYLDQASIPYSQRLAHLKDFMMQCSSRTWATQLHGSTCRCCHRRRGDIAARLSGPPQSSLGVLQVLRRSKYMGQ